MIEKDKSVLLSLPFVRFAPFFAAGMLTVYLGGGVSGAIFFAAAAAAFIFLSVKGKKIALCAAGALCGIVLMFAYTRLYLAPIRDYAGKTLNAEIRVLEITERSGQSEELIAKANLGGRMTKLRLSCAEALPEDHIADVTIELDVSDNDNYAQDLSDGILLSGEITEIRSAEYAGTSIYGVFRVIHNSFHGRLAENVFGESREFASAMLFGEDVKLSPKNTEYLRVSGAAHYTAVSGAHFAVLATALLMLIPQNRRKTRITVSLLFAPAGVLFYGVSPSVLRASVMFLLYSIGMLLHRKTPPLNSLCIAVTVIPIFSPLTIVDAGFAMSVLGVFGVGVAGPAFSEKLCEFIPDKAKNVLSPIATALICSLCAVLYTAPISAALFKSVSLLGVVTSLLLAPLMAAAMAFMLFLGVTEAPLFAVPIEWSMKLAALIVRAFGRLRSMSLSLDFKGSWVLMALLALIVTYCAFADLKGFALFGKITAVLMAAIIALSSIIALNRREVRFVGNTYTSAAIVFDGRTAAVFISGGGDGLSMSISRVMREGGAVRITKLSAPDADYGGALAIKELSEMLPIDEVCSNDIAEGLLPSLNVTPVGNELFSAGGVTISSADADNAPDADILLYGGNMNKVTESTAEVAVYFSKKEYALPENFRNARVDRDFRVAL